MRLGEVMTKQPTCCTPFCTAQMAAEMMKHADTPASCQYWKTLQVG